MTWSVARRLRGLLSHLAPPGTQRGRAVDAAENAIRRALALDPGGLIRRATPRRARRVSRRALEAFQDLRLQGSIADWSSQLHEIISSEAPFREVLVFPPSLDWKTQLFQRPQQLATSLARQGALVFYMEPRSSSRGHGLHKEGDRLYLCRVPARVFSDLANPTYYILTWNRDQLENFKASRLIYDFVDDLRVFHTEGPKNLEKEHGELLKRATLVLVTAQILYEQVQRDRPDALSCPNGVDYDHFARARNASKGVVPQDMEPVLEGGMPIVGYYGALAQWFDYSLVRSVAATRQDLSFLLIGPDHDGSLKRSGLIHLPNVHWLGTKPYEDLPSYLRYFDVGIIPFRLNRITHATSPLKLFEYMAGGKPVVATPMRESMRYPGVIAAEGQTEFSDALDRTLKDGRDPGYLSVIDRVARENTWEIRAEAILSALSSKAAN